MRSLVQETDLSGKKDRAHGNFEKNKKKNNFPYSTGIHVLTLIDGYHRLRHS